MCVAECAVATADAAETEAATVVVVVDVAVWW